MEPPRINTKYMQKCVQRNKSRLQCKLAPKVTYWYALRKHVYIAYYSLSSNQSQERWKKVEDSLAKGHT